jgi:hypothetical protein
MFVKVETNFQIKKLIGESNRLSYNKFNPDYSRIIQTIKLHLNIGRKNNPNFGCSYPDVKSGGVYLRELTLFGFRFATQHPSHIHT